MQSVFRNTFVKHAAILAAAASFTSIAVTSRADPKAEQASAEISKAFADAYNASDAAGVAKLFVRDGVFLTPNGKMLSDAKEIEEAIAARIAAGWTRERIRVISARPEGEDVLAFIAYSIAGTGPRVGKELNGYAAQLLTKVGPDWRFKSLAANLSPAIDAAVSAK